MSDLRIVVVLAAVLAIFVLGKVRQAEECVVPMMMGGIGIQVCGSVVCGYVPCDLYRSSTIGSSAHE